MCKAPGTRYHPSQKTWDLTPGFLNMCTWWSPTSLWDLDEEAYALRGFVGRNPESELEDRVGLEDI